MLTFIKRTVQIILALIILAWLITVIALQFESHEYYQVSEQEKTEATEYLKGKIAKTPDNWVYETFSPEAGINLRTGSIDHPDAKATIVLVPGFTGTIELSMATIVKLNQAGYRVASIEYRGQGDSHRPLNNPEKGYVEDYAILASDVAKFARKVKRADEPMVFMSMSKGAHITMRMAAEQNLDVKAFSLVVPMIQINSGELEYSSLSTLANTLNTIGFGKMYAPGNAQWPPLPLRFGEANRCNANPETAQTQSALFALNESLRTRGVTIKWLKETVGSSKKLLDPQYMKAVSQPVKIFTAGDDRLVRTDVATEFCKSLADCEVTHFEEARHCINREDETVMNEIIRQSLVHFDKALAEL